MVYCKDQQGVNDTIAPIVEILTPSDSQKVNTIFQLEYIITEENFDSASAYIDNMYLLSTSDPASEISLDASNIVDGEYDLKLIAVDLYGNKSSDTVTISLIRPDIEMPVINILAPLENQLVGENFDLIYSTTEEELNYISIYLNGVLITSTNELATRIKVNTTNFDEGTYYLKVLATDIAGNIGSDSVRIRLELPDTEPPLVSITSPSNNEVFYDSVSVVIDASDNEGISNVQLFFNNALQGELKDPPYIFNTDVKSYRNGTYTLEAVAVDFDGNTSRATRDIAVITEPVLEKTIQFSASKGGYWNSILLEWISTPQANSYEIYRLDSGSNEFQLIGRSRTNQFVDTFDALSNPQTNIFYKVRAFNSKTEFGAFSDLDYGYYTGKSYAITQSFNISGVSEHITVDEAGNFYLSETSSSLSIMKYSSNGAFVENYFSCGTPRGFEFISNNEALVACSSENKIKIIDNEGNIIREWGSSGDGNGQFTYFRQVVIDGQTVFIVDHSNHRIQKMSLDGDFLLKWGESVSLNYPWGITIFKNMVVVSSDRRLQFFAKDGTFIKSWGFNSFLYEIASDENYIYVGSGNTVLKLDEDRNIIDRIGDGDGGVNGLEVMENGDVVVLDTSEKEVRVYRKNQ